MVLDWHGCGRNELDYNRIIAPLMALIERK